MQTLNSSTQDTETDISQSSSSAWLTERVPGQPGLLHLGKLKGKKQS